MKYHYFFRPAEIMPFPVEPLYSSESRLAAPLAIRLPERHVTCPGRESEYGQRKYRAIHSRKREFGRLSRFAEIEFASLILIEVGHAEDRPNTDIWYSQVLIL
jgi:hypothetical protein